jgi:glycosyltransferase involved in cell wall biosynthesis
LCGVINNRLKEKLPLVSIVTPAYNAEKYIKDTIKSVINQTYPLIEHIIIDDGSTDGTPQILREFEKLYNLRWFSKINEGQAIAVNKGFELSSGEIIGWLNADDVLFSKDVIESIVNIFLKNREIEVIYGHMAIIDDKNRILKIQYAPPKINLNILLTGHYAPCIFYRRYVVNHYKLDPNLECALDYDQCLRMAKDLVNFARIDKIIIGWRKHTAATSLSNVNNLKRENEILRLKYGKETNLMHFPTKMVCYSYILIRKLCGVTELLRLYSGNRSNLAFNVKIDNLLKVVLRQVVPYS